MSRARKRKRNSAAKLTDATRLMVCRHLLASVAEEMGLALQQSAISPNVKERRDFSCAVLDGRGELVAHAAHIPVHLGSAHFTVPAVLQEVEVQTGDVIVLNDPHRGGTHLNDVTVVAPFWVGKKRLAFLMNRAHHADIGGAEPGSMSGATDLYGEGLCLPPVHLIRGGKPMEEVWKIFQANARDGEARKGDLLAQCAALNRGALRMQALVDRLGETELSSAMTALLDHGEALTQALFRSWPQGQAQAELSLDGPGTPLIRLRIQNRGGRLLLDFRGTSKQVAGSWNTHRAVTFSALFYVLQALAPEELPETSGSLRPLSWHLPEGSLIASTFPAGVAAGNVETSQRLVDVLLQALAGLLGRDIPASSQGSMNNFLFGGRFSNPEKGDFVYYETLGGGAGAGPHGPGADAVQSHMTNTRNTPIEVMEAELPVRVRQLAIRRGSGGRGLHSGGHGLIKEVEFLEAARVSVTATRRRSGAPGAAGGEAGKAGVDSWFQGTKKRKLTAGQSVAVNAGDRIRLATPGGGGWGKAPASAKAKRSKPPQSADPAGSAEH